SERRPRTHRRGTSIRSSAFAIAAILALALVGAETHGAPKKKDPAKKPVKVPPARRVTIKPVDPAAGDDVRKSAKKIDELVNANHAKLHVAPNSKTTDEEFVRRIYLDIAGTIPTYRQITVFLASTALDRRARLIDTLLNAPGYASHHFNYWADILRLTD